MLNQFSVPAACVPIAYDASAMYRGPPDESVQWLKSEYDALTQQLNGVILISTFIAGLFVAFLSFTRDLVGDYAANYNCYRCALFLGFLSITVQLLLIIVAGRTIAVCHRVQMLHRRPAKVALSNMQMIVYACEQVNVLSALTFLVAVLVLAFEVFFKTFAYLISFYTVASICVCLVVFLNYRVLGYLKADGELLLQILGKSFRRSPDPLELPVTAPCTDRRYPWKRSDASNQRPASKFTTWFRPPTAMNPLSQPGPTYHPSSVVPQEEGPSPSLHRQTSGSGILS